MNTTVEAVVKNIEQLQKDLDVLQESLNSISSTDDHRPMGGKIETMKRNIETAKKMFKMDGGVFREVRDEVEAKSSEMGTPLIKASLSKHLVGEWKNDGGFWWLKIVKKGLRMRVYKKTGNGPYEHDGWLQADGEQVMNRSHKYTVAEGKLIVHENLFVERYTRI